MEIIHFTNYSLSRTIESEKWKNVNQLIDWLIDISFFVYLLIDDSLLSLSCLHFGGGFEGRVLGGTWCHSMSGGVLLSLDCIFIYEYQ
jgi:hypothetical protein